MRLSTGDRDQLNRLAEEQSRLRQQLEQIQRDENARNELLGRLDQAQREMQEVEEAFRDGSSEGDLEEKQQRILSRLLDAQRSVNRRDFNPERESRVGEDISGPSAPEIPRELLRESDRLRNDLLKAEADRYPAQYRALVEAYLRSLNGTRR
jgi:DNA repair exonuclease SbcCD ATPase subunit